MSNETKERKGKDRKWLLWLLLALIVIIGGLSIWLYQQKEASQEENLENYSQKLALQHELDSLLFAHDQVKAEYGELANELLLKDSTILAKADSIRMLILRQGDYNRIRRELNLLREESSMYMAHIDSLFRVTKILEAENREIRGQYQAEQIRSAQLSQEKEFFAEKVAVGSILKANNISVRAYRINAGNIKVTDKAKRTDRLEVCFTIQENLVVESGKRDVFLRITRPDGQILSLGDNYTFSFNGETIPYSVKERIRYVNKEMTLCMKWDKLDPTADAMEGTYNFVLIVDDYVIGQSQITLK